MLMLFLFKPYVATQSTARVRHRAVRHVTEVVRTLNRPGAECTHVREEST
jgi:hypothetical protein